MFLQNVKCLHYGTLRYVTSGWKRGTSVVRFFPYFVRVKDCYHIVIFCFVLSAYSLHISCKTCQFIDIMLAWYLQCHLISHVYIDCVCCWSYA